MELGIMDWWKVFEGEMRFYKSEKPFGIGEFINF